MCASPSAHSDSSSGNGRLSSAGSEAGGLNNNNNNCTTKLNEILRSKCVEIYGIFENFEKKIFFGSRFFNFYFLSMYILRQANFRGA